ncbi:molybdopterin molybdotransferase MoeA [Sphingosinicellaceae bacterium]|nr:molybdopterin molybdotransferase MoeA [Sphingosinicellaceae bacterium]
MSDLLAVAEAQARLLAGLETLPSEILPLADAAGRRSAGEVVARLTQPPFAASAMDGYAIRWADRAGPWRLIGEASAGHVFEGSVGAGKTVRISTGAPVPDGADTVVVQEDVALDGDRVTLSGDGPPRAGAHIRPRGLDFESGAVLVDAGAVLTPTRLGLLAGGGHGRVAVPRRPRVVILSTGDELVPPGSVPGPGQIVSTGGTALAALFNAAGSEVYGGGIVRDDRNALAAAIRAAADADLLVTIGGASVGDHDLVRPVLIELGATIDFWRIAMRPGKPMMAGTLGGQRIVGLPGNPVSAYVCALLFVVPMLKRWAGDPEPLPKRFTARLTAPLPANDRREDYLRARARNTGDGVEVTAATLQDSSMLRTLADSSALIVRAPYATPAVVNQTVSCVALDFVPGVA